MVIRLVCVTTLGRLGTIDAEVAGAVTALRIAVVAAVTVEAIDAPVAAIVAGTPPLRDSVVAAVWAARTSRPLNRHQRLHL